jgi:hypothetical protein
MFNFINKSMKTAKDIGELYLGLSLLAGEKVVDEIKDIKKVWDNSASHNKEKSILTIWKQSKKDEYYTGKCTVEFKISKNLIDEFKS